jgi:hypothetical protein
VVGRPCATPHRLAKLCPLAHARNAVDVDAIDDNDGATRSVNSERRTCHRSSRHGKRPVQLLLRVWQPDPRRTRPVAVGEWSHFKVTRHRITRSTVARVPHHRHAVQPVSLERGLAAVRHAVGVVGRHTTRVPVSTPHAWTWARRRCSVLFRERGYAYKHCVCVRCRLDDRTLWALPKAEVFGHASTIVLAAGVGPACARVVWVG